MTLFGYRAGRSVLHRLDPRLKFLMVCLFSLCLIRSGTLGTLIYAAVVFTGFKTAALPLKQTLSGLKSFGLLLFFVFLARAFSEPGIPLWQWWGMTLTREGIHWGSMIAFKFFLIMLTGLIFSSTTSLSDIKHALQWLFKPIPGIPEQRLAVMVGLSFGFIPILFKQADQISDAQKARCGDHHKNPIRRAFWFAMPLLKKTFANAEHIHLAMTARCYSDDRTPPRFQPSGNEFLFSAGTLFTALILLLT